MKILRKRVFEGDKVVKSSVTLTYILRNGQERVKEIELDQDQEN